MMPPLHDCVIDPPLPPQLLAVEAVEFVGREAELIQLNEGWRLARAGRYQLLLVAGEAGIGKTRLALEFARARRAEGATILIGCSDEELLVPYQPFVECLSWYVRSCDESDLQAHLAAAGGGAELGLLIPELRRRVPDLPNPPSMNPESQRYRLFETVAALLASASRMRPMLVVLDDLHWADKATLLLLRHIMRSARPASLAIIATYRESEIGGRSHPLADVLSALRREHNVTHLPLRGLDVADCRSVGGGHRRHGSAGAPGAVRRRQHARQPIFCDRDAAPPERHRRPRQAWRAGRNGNRRFGVRSLRRHQGDGRAPAVAVERHVQPRAQRGSSDRTRVRGCHSERNRRRDRGRAARCAGGSRAGAVDHDSLRAAGHCAFPHRAGPRDAVRRVELGAPREPARPGCAGHRAGDRRAASGAAGRSGLPLHTGSVRRICGQGDRLRAAGRRSGGRRARPRRSGTSVRHGADVARAQAHDAGYRPAARRSAHASGPFLRRARRVGARGARARGRPVVISIPGQIERRCEIVLQLASARFLLFDLRPVEQYAAEARQLAERLDRPDIEANAIAWLGPVPAGQTAISKRPSPWIGGPWPGHPASSLSPTDGTAHAVPGGPVLGGVGARV